MLPFFLAQINITMRAHEFSIPNIGINVRSDGNMDYADLIVDGKKKLETRNTDSLRPYVGKRVSIVKTGKGRAYAIGAATVGEPIKADEKEFRKLDKEHLVPAGSKFDIQPGSTKFLYPMLNPKRYDRPREVGHGIVSRKVFVADSTFNVNEVSEYTPSPGVEIDAHRQGDTLWINYFEVPAKGKGMGTQEYFRFEKSLPKDIKKIRLVASDTGYGKTHVFWDKMGFDYAYPDDDNEMIKILESASGYIPSEKEKNDPRFKTALTVDIKPDTLRKNAKAFGFKVSRAGIPPLLRK
jgi:hypothetical protein